MIHLVYTPVARPIHSAAIEKDFLFTRVHLQWNSRVVEYEVNLFKRVTCNKFTCVNKSATCTFVNNVVCFCFYVVFCTFV